MAGFSCSRTYYHKAEGRTRKKELGGFRIADCGLRIADFLNPYLVSRCRTSSADIPSIAMLLALDVAPEAILI
jgi:hypothetical protein